MDDRQFEDWLAMFSLHDAPGHLLRRAHQRSYEIFRQAMPDGISRQQVALMIALGRRKNASQNDIVEATGIDKSTLREMIDRMVSKGLISRQRDPDDRRSWLLNLTETGRAELAERIPRIEQLGEEILKPLASAEREQLLALLKKLTGLE